ncbi:uncharacterized protein LOC108588084 isoform X4 [Callithrix jacchus]
MAEEVSALMKATVLMRQPGRVQEIVGALRKGSGDQLQENLTDKPTGTCGSHRPGRQKQILPHSLDPGPWPPNCEN